MKPVSRARSRSSSPSSAWASTPAACEANLRRVLDAAGDGCFVRIDMEQSRWVDPTLDVFERVWRDGRRNVGVVLQAYLYRTADDLARVNALGARVRLCKGAYQEPPSVAWPRKADVNASFVRLMRSLLENGVDPEAFATHDPEMIAATRAHARALDLDADRFEFQMLFGVRRDLQARLVDEGHRVRVYVPFGSEWFPYFMRRLGSGRPTCCSCSGACSTKGGGDAPAAVTAQAVRSRAHVRRAEPRAAGTLLPAGWSARRLFGERATRGFSAPLGALYLPTLLAVGKRR